MVLWLPSLGTLWKVPLKLLTNWRHIYFSLCENELIGSRTIQDKMSTNRREFYIGGHLWLLPETQTSFGSKHSFSLAWGSYPGSNFTTARLVYSLPSTCLSSTFPTWSQPLLTLSPPRSCKVCSISPLILVLPLHVNFQSIFTISKLTGKVGSYVCT